LSPNTLTVREDGDYRDTRTYHGMVIDCCSYPGRSANTRTAKYSTAEYTHAHPPVLQSTVLQSTHMHPPEIGVNAAQFCAQNMQHLHAHNSPTHAYPFRGTLYGNGAWHTGVHTHHNIHPTQTHVPPHAVHSTYHGTPYVHTTYRGTPYVHTPHTLTQHAAFIHHVRNMHAMHALHVHNTIIRYLIMCEHGAAKRRCQYNH